MRAPPVDVWMVCRYVLRHEAGFGRLRGGAKAVEVEEVGGRLGGNKGGHECNDKDEKAPQAKLLGGLLTGGYFLIGVVR